jgi:hypothetical protein
MLSNHEVVPAYGLESEAIVESASAMIVDEDGEVDVFGTAPSGFIENPVHEVTRNSRAVMLLEYI